MSQYEQSEALTVW